MKEETVQVYTAGTDGGLHDMYSLVVLVCAVGTLNHGVLHHHS